MMTTMSAIEQETVPDLTLGWRLRMAMEHAGLTALDMARELELARDTVGRWIHDDTVPKRIYLRAWAERTNVSYEWLVDEPAPKVARGTRSGAGRGSVTDNKKYVERGKSRSHKGAESNCYRYCHRQLLSERNRGCHLDRHARRLLDHCEWVASAERRGR